MELPHLGDYCSQPDCNQLDYLPIKCSLCSKMFCNNHHKYEAHQCPERYKLDVQVPICPLCEKPVPSKPGQPPDLAVNDHLENNCQSKNKKIYSNKCSVPRCKQREVISLKCDRCSFNFCLKHRHASDHDCKGEASARAARREQTLNGSIFKNWFSNTNGTSNANSSRSNSNALASQSRLKSSAPNNIVNVHHAPPTAGATMAALQGGMTEEEALAKAILASTRRNDDTLTEVSSTSEDEDLARAIAASLEETELRNGTRTKQKSAECLLS